MPLHDFECPFGHVSDAFVSQGVNSIRCEKCGSIATKVFLRPVMISCDYPGYNSPVTGKWVEGKRAHIEDLKRTGCRLYEDGEKEAFLKRRAREEEAFDARIDATIDQTIQAMPVQKRERLQSEMDAGVTAVVERSTPKMG